ncbi:protein argonaute-2-like protein [Dinothrombium tinctorium]|uniref:Protein argonaute-2-like protein n=1 Tax=Dinothrombium tinctorium TaxID=1965070 RepID=A0A3S3P0F8_9ACAR|nr:protein argonaute-2-like protein [Dinothrombium tinctorium]
MDRSGHSHQRIHSERDRGISGDGAQRTQRLLLGAEEGMRHLRISDSQTRAMRREATSEQRADNRGHVCSSDARTQEPSTSFASFKVEEPNLTSQLGIEGAVAELAITQTNRSVKGSLKTNEELKSTNKPQKIKVKTVADEYSKATEQQEPVASSSKWSDSKLLESAESKKSELKELPIESTHSPNIKFAAKQSPGTLGRPILLLTNYFNMFVEHGSFYQYDIVIEPQASATSDAFPVGESGQKKERKLSKTWCREVIDAMISSQEDMLFKDIKHVFDYGKKIITHLPLNLSEARRIDVVLRRNFKEFKFVVEVKPCKNCALRIDAFTEEVLQALNVILKFGILSNRIPIRGALLRYNKTDISQNKQLALGCKPSVRYCEGGLMLNVDTAHAIFHKGDSILDIIDTILRRESNNKSPGVRQIPFISPDMRIKIVKEIKGLKMSVKHLPHVFIINDLSDQPASKLYFFKKEIRDGETYEEKIIVEEHFETKHEIILEHSNLPCIVTGNKKNPKYFPLEICKLLDNQSIRELSPTRHFEAINDISKIINHKHQNTSEKFMQIQKEVDDVIKDCKNFSAEFGFTIENKPQEVDGRVLEHPSLLFGNSNDMVPTTICNWNMADKTVHTNSCIDSWALVNFSTKMQRFFQDFSRSFYPKLKQIGDNMNIKIKQPVGIKDAEDAKTFQEIEKVFDNLVENLNNLQLVICITPDKQPYIYNAIKQISEQKHGIVTQCLNDIKYLKKITLNSSYIANILLKINAKLGGINVIIQTCTLRSWAVVRFFNWDHSNFVQTFMKTAEKMGFKISTPKMIEFSQNLNQIKRLFERLKREMPSIQLVICLMPQCLSLLDSIEQCGCEFEIQTCCLQLDPNAIKRDLTLKTEDGVSRPVHYRVLFNEGNLNSDDLQRLTHFLCFIYAPSTKSVSLPAPVKYADKIAQRLKQYLMAGSNSLTLSENLKCRLFYT